MIGENNIKQVNTAPSKTLRLRERGIIDESEKAIQIEVCNGGGKRKFQWIPKSCLVWVKPEGSIYHPKLFIKQWFIARNQLWELI